MSTLNTVQKYFPHVEEIEDAKEGAVVEVTRRDESTSKRRQHGTCALAVAAKRCFEADGVIISITKAYVVHGKKAFRYDLPEAISREVISFDRGSGFSPGTYQLKEPARPLG